MLISPKSVPQVLSVENFPLGPFSQSLNTASIQRQNIEQISMLLNIGPVQALPDTPFKPLTQEDCKEQHSDHSASASQIKQHTILSQLWRPCSGEMTLGEHLDCIQFPVSYRDLVYRWIALGRPALSNLRTPLSLRASSLYCNQRDHSSLNLQEICEGQEAMIILSIRDYFKRGHSSNTKLFVNFASHLDIYAALHVELSCLESGLLLSRSTQIRLYEGIWRNALRAFDLDRSICSARSSHDCLRYLIWGEVYNWQLDEVERRFEDYKNQSSIIQPVLSKRKLGDDFSTPTCPLLVSSTSSPSVDRMTESSSIPSSSSLPMQLSAFRIIDVDADTSGIPLSLQDFSSYWYESSNNTSFGTPSTRPPSTPGASPLRSGDPSGDTVKNECSFELDDADHTSNFFTQEKWQNTINFLQNMQDSSLSQSSPLDGTELERRFLKCSSHPSADYEKISPESGDTQSDTQTSSLAPLTLETLENIDLIAASSYKSKCTLSMPTTPLLKAVTGGNYLVRSPIPTSPISEKRDSTLSIGSSFKSESAVDKVEHYRTILQNTASQLDTAARLLDHQASQLHYKYQSRKKMRQMAAAITKTVATRTTIIPTSTSTVKRARPTGERLLGRPSRPRSNTTI